MSAIFSTISDLLVFIGVIGTLWSVVGVPVGIVVSILKLFNVVKSPWKKNLLWCFGGLGLIIVALIFDFILNVIAGFFGIQINTMTLPQAVPR